MATEQSAPIDLPKLRALAAEGYLSCRTHPTDPLLIWNYTQKTQWDRNWTPETRMCRGLITTPEGEVIARPFEKFYNAGEWLSMGNAIPVEPFEAYEKLDGSLGILYHSSEGPMIATRGAFSSPQALMGSQLLRRLGGPFDKSLTYLFEIIYPNNRIVVNYGERSELVLLAVIETATGREVPLTEFKGFTQAKRYDVTDFDAIQALGQDHEEGFVVRFESGLRLKIKLDEYVRLHRLLTGLTPRKVWEVLSAGQSLDDFTKGVPEEFATWLTATAKGLQSEYDLIAEICELDFRRVPPDATRREQAEVIKTLRHPAMIFKLLDGKSIEPLIWKAIYPPPANAFRGVDEAVA